MSLSSTFTSASINGWRSTGAGYTNNYVIPPPSPVTNGRFGYTCVISGNGDYCAVTTFLSNVSNVYVFIKNSDGTWSLQYTVTGISNATESPIAINHDGDVLAFSGFGGTWPLYIHTRTGSTWSLTQTISLGANSTFFANSLAMDSTGSYIFCGQQQFLSGQGRVALYYKSGSTWSLLQTIVPTDPTPNVSFGRSVATNSNASYLIVSCPTINSSNGAIYVFNGIGTWTQQQKITSFSGFGNSGTGGSVCVDDTGTYLFFNVQSTTLGVASRVYVYIRSGSSWAQQALLTGSTTDIYNSFGDSICVDGTAGTLLIKAYSEDFNATSRAGKIYVYNRIGTDWTNIQTCSTTPLQTDSMQPAIDEGVDISNDGTIFIFGAPSINTYGTASGAVFVFSN